MSKSYWLKDQKGNFSNEQEDTFDESKRYVGIRLQQGVPLLDRDWNELEDIRRYEEVMLRKWYVGNGTPDEGFKISEVGPLAKNDFKIKAGRCIVDGFEVINDRDILYTQQKGVKKPLSIGTDRVDTVYLDVWIEEVNSAEDPALKNSQDVNIETCVRHKLAWQVKVSEGSAVYPKDLPSHHYYNIAKITRVAGRDTILDTDIEDLRRTGLGRDIAIGDNRHRAGKIRLWQESNNEDDCVSHAIGTESFHNIYGAGKKYANSIGHRFYRGGGELIAQIGVGGLGNPANRLNSYFAGNVGIGTRDPRAKLEVTGDVKVTGNFIKDVKKTSPLSDAGWYRIAQGPERGKTNAGIFEIRWSASGRHGHVRFAVGANYGDDKGSQITILDQSSYIGKIVEKIRLLMKGTYDRHFIEFYFNGNIHKKGSESYPVPFVIYQYSGYGWSLIEPSPGSIPEGYTAHELRADVLFATRSGTEGGVFTVINDGNVGIGTTSPSEKLTISKGDLKIEGGRSRHLKIVSDKYWAGIDLVAREEGEAGNPYIDFTHGELGKPNYGIRIYAPTNDNFVIEGGNVGIGTPSPGAKLDVNGFTKSLGISVNNATNTGVGRGLWLWKPSDPNHVIYSASPKGKSPANVQAAKGYFDDKHRLRLRTATGQGFLFENNKETALVDIDSDDGKLWTKGAIYSGNSDLYFTRQIIIIRE